MVSPIRDGNGEPYQILSISRDITAQREVEQALRDSRTELAEHADTLEKNVAHRTAELHEISSELEAYSYTISHDLRASIRAMQSFAECLREEFPQITPEGQDYIRRIITAAGRLDQLIQDVLISNRLAKAEFKLERIDPNKVLAGILESDYHLHAAREGIKVQGVFPDLLANEALLYQCFTNLLGNAIKFVSAETEPDVTISCEVHGDRALIAFADNGIGLDPRSMEVIFGLFQQVDASQGGTGIGLAVARKAAERMRGTLTVKKSLPEKGSTFILSLRIAI